VKLVDRFECASCGAGGHRMDFMGDHMHCQVCGDEWSEDPADGRALPSVGPDEIVVGIGDRVKVGPLTWCEVMRVNRKSIVVDWPSRGPTRILPHRVSAVSTP
jgi:hypothetical protein